MDETIQFTDLRRLSKLLSISPRTLRGWARNPVRPIPHYRVGGKLLFRWSEVERWLEQFRVKPLSVDKLLDGMEAETTSH